MTCAEIANAASAERHPLNAPGPFFVERQMCIACLAPLHAAPELMGYLHGGPGCYFHRQPETAEEHEHAVEAVCVSCCGAVRYGGSDPAVIERIVGGD